eukprot:651549-Prorocentrum_minimum.AAC.1
MFKSTALAIPAATDGSATAAVTTAPAAACALTALRRAPERHTRFRKHDELGQLVRTTYRCLWTSTSGANVRWSGDLAKPRCAATPDLSTAVGPRGVLAGIAATGDPAATPPVFLRRGMDGATKRVELTPHLDTNAMIFTKKNGWRLTQQRTATGVLQ